MKLTKSKFSFFSKDFASEDDFEDADDFTDKNDSLDENDSSNDMKFGIEKIYYNGSVLSVRILKETDRREDDRLLQYAIAGFENPDSHS